MKAVICGAGQVGASIAAYLAEEGHDVTVVDHTPDRVAQVSESKDVAGIVGYASHPAVLAKAGTADADMFIAATYSDEINMVACQVAHSLFNVPLKIARVRDQSYLDPAWSKLYSRDDLPVDVVISPEVEVARAIANHIRVPGAYNIIPLADGLAQLISVICKPNCPLLNTPLKHITSLFPDLSTVVLVLVRGDVKIIPTGDDEMRAGDEVYFVTSTEHLSRSMAAFGYDEPETRRALIIGGGKVGARLAADIIETMPSISLRMIESNKERAEIVSERLPGIQILNGSGLDKELLEESNIGMMETVIAVTNHGESNVLISLLAKQYGCERAITLVNNNSFTPLLAGLGMDAIINPRTITVSTILQHIRRGRIKEAHSLRDGFAEILEVEALDTSAIVNTPIREIKRPKTMVFGLIVRDGKIIVPKPDSIIKPDDRVIILSEHGQVKKVEQMFAVRPEYF